MTRYIVLLALLAVCGLAVIRSSVVAAAAAAAAAAEGVINNPTTTTIVVDLDQPTTPFDHYWKKSFGSGHAALTLRKDWQDHLKKAIPDLGLQGIRHHGLLDDDMRVVVGRRPEGEEGPRFIYNFTLVEQSWRFQMEHNVTPVVELSFMPAMLANCTWTSPQDESIIVNPDHEPCKDPSMQYKAITKLPTSFDDWYDLVKALVQHAVDTFGLEQIQKWHFECWNEMWGTAWPVEYMKLYNASAHAVKAVHPTLRVGGPSTFQLNNVVEFAQNCLQQNIPFDFISTHMYPSDPQCPKDHTPGWGPDCLPEKVKLAKKSIEQFNVEFMLTEYNVGCCIGESHHDFPGAAAFIFRTIPQLHGILDVLSWWTFTDIFEEGTAVDNHTEYMQIYGLMTVSGVPKPSWRAFQLLHQYAGDRRFHVSIDEPQQQQHREVAAQQHQLDTAQCTTEEGTVLNGFDLGTVSTAKTVEECCAACQSQSTCSYWSFVLNETTCLLKSCDAGRTAQDGIVSGSRLPPPPPGQRKNRISAMATTRSTKATSTNRATSLDGVAVFLSYWSKLDDDHNRTAKVVFSSPSPSEAGTSTRLFGPRSSTVTASEYRIDDTHANAFAVWQAMGHPPRPNATQLDAMMKASEVVPSPLEISKEEDGLLSVEVVLPRNSAVMILLHQQQSDFEATTVE